jgi:hypothetical protein
MEMEISSGVFTILFTGIIGVITFFYLIIELIHLYYTRTTISQSILINIFLKKRLNNILPPWWSCKKTLEFNSINRPFLKYRVWIYFENKYLENSNFGCWVELDRMGRIENKSELKNRLEQSDSDLSIEIKKQLKREKLLNQLNIE